MFFLLRDCSYLKGEAKDLGTSRAELGRSPARRGAKHSREWLLAHCSDQVLDPDQVASSLSLLHFFRCQPGDGPVLFIARTLRLEGATFAAIRPVVVDGTSFLVGGKAVT